MGKEYGSIEIVLVLGLLILRAILFRDKIIDVIENVIRTLVVF